MNQHIPGQTSSFCLSFLGGLKCLSVLKCWEPLLSCVPHWPRFQLFSGLDNGRYNGFIIAHNTWVLSNTIVVKVLIVTWLCVEHCAVTLCNQLVKPPGEESEKQPPHPATLCSLWGKCASPHPKDWTLLGNLHVPGTQPKPHYFTHLPSLPHPVPRLNE